jgi:hypothetical protein
MTYKKTEQKSSTVNKKGELTGMLELSETILF